MTWSLSDIQELGAKGVSPHLEEDGAIYQLYYSSIERGGLAIDGMTNNLQLTQQGTIAHIQDLTIITTSEGNRRAYYVEKDPNTGTHEIYTALISADGLSLSGVSSTGITDKNSDQAWGVPDAVVLPNGKVRIYWVETDPNASTLANEVILSATSTTTRGINFIADAGRRVEGGYVDFEILKAKDNDWIAIMSSSPVTIPDQPQGIFVGVSKDGMSWEINENNLAPTEKSYLDPTGLLLPNYDNKWRIVMSSSLSILGDREYSLVASELTLTSSSSTKNLTLNGTSSSDNLIANSGEDFGSDLLNGEAGDDQLTAYRGADTLNGGSGSDILRAGNGKDLINGGVGADTLYGGFGTNTFQDSNDGEADKLYLKSDQLAYNWIYTKAGNSPNGEKADNIGKLDANDQIYIQGATTAQLTFGSATHTTPFGETWSGIGIYAAGTLEAVFTGGNLTQAQLQAITFGTPA